MGMMVRFPDGFERRAERRAAQRAHGERGGALLAHARVPAVEQHRVVL